MSSTQSISPKQMLRRALSLAQEAVNLDTARDLQGACAAYNKSIAILGDVMRALQLSVEKQEGDVHLHQSELKRVMDIRTSYVNRVNTLSTKYHLSTVPAISTSALIST
ncbi:hypothetical protein HGRIS_007687 [Hohenbuehelia grisea]|uniref:MIT domain-containing protein n=1 Tax=Hohenbuehelia grisea TaxID=104357 RepID=A0ABR3J5Z5_9AGAR